MEITIGCGPPFVFNTTGICNRIGNGPDVIYGNFGSSLPGRLGYPAGIQIGQEAIRFYYDSKPKYIPKQYHEWCCFASNGVYITLSNIICKKAAEIPSNEIVKLYKDYKNGVKFDLRFHSKYFCLFYDGECPICIETAVVNYLKFCETEPGKIYTKLVDMLDAEKLAAILEAKKDVSDISARAGGACSVSDVSAMSGGACSSPIIRDDWFHKRQGLEFHKRQDSEISTWRVVRLNIE